MLWSYPGVRARQVVAHADEEMRRASQLARDVGGRPATRSRVARCRPRPCRRRRPCAPLPAAPPPPRHRARGARRRTRSPARMLPVIRSRSRQTHSQSLGVGGAVLAICRSCHVSRWGSRPSLRSSRSGSRARARAQVTPGPRRAPPATAPTDPVGHLGQAHVARPRAGTGRRADVVRRDQSPSALLFYTSLIARSWTSSDDWSGGADAAAVVAAGRTTRRCSRVTARFEPVVYDFGRVYADMAIGRDDDEVRVGVRFRLGGGIEWNIPDAPGLGIGPVPALRPGGQSR